MSKNGEGYHFRDQVGYPWKICFLSLAVQLCCFQYGHSELTIVSVSDKPVSQSTTYNKTFIYPAEQAVDGDINSYCHTELSGDPHPWWRVDLGNQHCLGRISVMLRKNCCGYRFVAAVARAGLNANYAENRPCGSPATEAQSLTGAVVEFPCNTPRTARYVSLDIDPSSPGVIKAVLQIAEVTVEEYEFGMCARNSNVYPKFKSAYFETHFENGLIANPGPLVTQMARSLLLCADLCINHAQCLSFDFAPGSRQCHLHNLNATEIQITPTEDYSIYVLMD